MGTLGRIGCMSVLTCTVMAACTMKNATVPPDELMRQLQAGQPMLDCRGECGGAWGANRNKAAALDATGRWQELALLVMQVGYMTDLTYYYLGHAAENLGYLQPAQRYYRIAERLSVTQMSCHREEVDIQAVFKSQRIWAVCDGYTFPDALYPHLEAVEARLAALSVPEASAQPSRARRVVRRQVPQTPAAGSAPGPGQPPTSASASNQKPVSGFVEPVPTTVPASSDFFEPPPVRR